MYGPKMDFMATDALGREWQVATVQLDYATPSRFGLEYVAEDGSKKTPIMVHCALIGSLERFMSVLIEHTGGKFPAWMAPEQIRILSLNDDVLDYVKEVEDKLKECQIHLFDKDYAIRYTVDDRNESLGKKIREATKMKIPLAIIVGPKDAEARQLSLRFANGDEQKIEFSQIREYMTEFIERSFYTDKEYFGLEDMD